MGEQAADPTLIPDFHENADPGWAPVPGYLNLACNYQLMVDNLLDLTHVVFVHKTTLAGGGVTDTPLEVRTEGDRVLAQRMMINVDTAPIYRAVHEQAGLRSSHTEMETRPIDELTRRRFFAFCGIGNPAAFHRQLERFGEMYVGRRWFGDHHAYTPSDVRAVLAAADAAGAAWVVTTEKDWAKLRAVVSSIEAERFRRLDVAVRFALGDEDSLFTLIAAALRMPTA